ncbi:MAG TPA: type II toxin-antitoxin system Phd/YefM family antitoxin [Candidatus Methylomirabilis sp.]|nr:type II toxin-antitoxin system Phd/YefM family antitoxin [Candidatus Methylomirabilis sp.]HSB77765.1 type II toxin-antitoxin system Phd/YefM family antitoxin [Candidatus Methylomirabilis sp.]
MKRIPLSEVKDDLSRHLREAEKEEVVITRHGKPAGIHGLRTMTSTGAAWILCESVQGGLLRRTDNIPTGGVPITQLHERLVPAEIS